MSLGKDPNTHRALFNTFDVHKNGTYYDWRFPKPNWYVWGQKELGPIDPATYKPELNTDHEFDELLASTI